MLSLEAGLDARRFVSMPYTLTPQRRPMGLLARGMSYLGHALRMITPLLPQLTPIGRAAMRVVRSGTLLLECRRDADCKTLVGRWDDLIRRCPQATPFQTAHWICPLLLHSQRMGRLRLITVSRGDTLLAVIPLEAVWGGRLRSIGTLMCDYLDPLVDPSEEQAVWAAVLGNINALAGGEVRELLLENLSEQYIPRIAMPKAAEGLGLRCIDEVVEPVSRINTTGTWEEFLSRLDAHDRKELRRKLRKAEDTGSAVLHRCETEADMERELADLFKLMSRSAGGKGRKARWMFPAHFAVAGRPLMQAGRLRIYRLMIQNQHAAGLIAFPTPTGEILWAVAIDPDLRQWSPGIVTFALLIRQAIQNGDTVLDLLRGTHDYKYRIGATDFPLYRRVIRWDA